MAAAPRALTPTASWRRPSSRLTGGRCRRLKSFVRLYKLPADQRNAHAHAGALWEQGRGGLSKDDREAARLYQLAASSRINLARRWQACGNFERRGRSPDLFQIPRRSL